MSRIIDAVFSFAFAVVAVVAVAAAVIQSDWKLLQLAIGSLALSLLYRICVELSEISDE